MAKEKKKTEAELLAEILEVLKSIDEKLIPPIQTKDDGPKDPPPGPPGSGG